MPEYPYSEIFYSIQGEGRFTGRPTAWLRYFGCNLQCNGFGQKDPTDPRTYVLPYQDFDVSTVEKIEDLPVWKFGCDSSYSWSARYKHLVPSGTPEQIGERILDVLPNKCFALDQGSAHMCFTGGEPLIPRSQECTNQVLEYISAFPRGRRNLQVTFETNGTKPLTKHGQNLWRYPADYLFSCSPKLWTVAGEKNEKAIKPEIVASYMDHGDVQLKFVIGIDERQWEELLRVVALYRAKGIDDVWVMPVGATEEAQEEIAGKVATKAIAHGFSVSARVHCYLWGNIIGV